MRAAEEDGIGSGAVTGLALMETAGRGAVRAMMSEWPGMQTGRAIVMCGPGNNGGDGYVIARRLRDLGWTVEVFAMGDPADLSGDAARMHGLWAAPVAALSGLSEVEPADVVVDALFGTGLRRPLPAEVEAARETVVWAGDRRTKLVAVDCLSGLEMESGRYLGDASRVTPADLTVTFHRAKTGHHLGGDTDLSGALHIADIDLPAPVAGASVPLLEGPMMVLSKSGGSHKYDHGHAVVVSGPEFRTGATRLSAMAALRVGAGLVTLVGAAAALREHAAHLTEVMLAEVDGAEALADFLKDPRINAVCLGPALGVDRAEALVRGAAGGGASLVLDADALSAFADQVDALSEVVACVPGVVLTPHMGEFARLFPDLADAMSPEEDGAVPLSKLEAASRAAKRSGAVVCLKGPDTVIAAPDGRAAILSGRLSAPWLGTAGTGDVLAGLITGLMARGGAGFESAATAAWLHRQVARDVGPGLIAGDLIAALAGRLEK